MTSRLQDLQYMALALRLAANGRGTTSPNPMVGALVVREGRIVGKGFHLHPGEPHAEIHALAQAGMQALGATLYVTLEPCYHHNKRTPPCVPAIVQAGIHRVVIAMVDPNPLVNGKGAAALKRAGLSVTMNVARREAETLNETYCHWITTKKPYVTMKAGITLDGQIATASGESRWITSRASREESHQFRAEMDAVLIGVGTVLADNPSLTARTGSRLNRLASRQPLRIVVDSTLRIPLNAKILSGQGDAKTLVATTNAGSAARLRALQKKGIETIVLPSRGRRVLLAALLTELGRRGITSVLVEGGSDVNASMLKAKLVNRVRLYLAPVLLGGENAKGLIGGKSPEKLSQAVKLKNMRVRSLGRDIVVEGEL